MITVGIPTHNEEKTIASCVNSITLQIRKNDEIIIVASGCTDNTIPEIKKIMKRDKRVKLIIEPERRGKSSALNEIIKKAKSDIIVQTDGDVVVDEGAINKLVKYFDNKHIGGVSGNPIPLIPKKNLFYYWTIMTYDKIGKIRELETKKGKFWHMSGYLLAFRKKALPKVPFAKGAVDAWMGQIIKQNGYDIVYESDAKVFVKAPLTIRDFINQKARVRAGYVLLPKKPRTIKKEILFFPRELFKIPIIQWPNFLFSGLIYSYSWIKGYYLAKTNKSLKQVWKIPYSTK